ncbi:OmpA family protein [Dokdonia sp. Hel_I_53]|uniref:OmpA family protein n=1 Tax=Dokdonia sp. Hel_I_53 TaxID=1566287 RepID=UPI0011990158|nr:OmpA family protein [Dokdonia sp. Hel_I_53]TVZ52616.1 outer membrane protein OmpA-like peptidoglycan-associated protein [Dokdonia sp. Hel_I_53]
MKHFSRFLVASLLILAVGSVNAQDENNPWSVSVGVNAVDTYPTGEAAYDIPSGMISDEFPNEFYNVEDHWNILPSVSYINVSRYVGNGLVVGVSGSLNRIDQRGDQSVNDLQYYAADAEVGYSLRDLINGEGGWFDPSLYLGGGYTWFENLNSDVVGDPTANAAAGVKIWFTENFNLGLQSKYKHNFRTDSRKHFQHVASLGIAFGGKDTDGDGIYDRDDECPEVAGLPEFNGCPDTDGDGIQDSKDACPTVFGLAEFDGCPDTDGDGIPDPKDACPTVAGIAALGGCPDADGDGIKDSDDECPNEAGPRENNGCPYADRDGDGVLDKDDECPDVVGTVANNGCPEVSVEVLAQLNTDFKNVLFDYNKASLRKESFETLDRVASVMMEYPNTRFLIEGHTDSRGSDSYNKKLSNERAASVRTYLTGKGIPAARLESQGFGEERPIATNNTAAGRQQNRRVVLSILDK